jgi:hypothetical protein
MTVTEQLKSILNENYLCEEGNKYKVELKPALTEKQIDDLSKKMPTGEIPDDIKDLIKFASGFKFHNLDGITFDVIAQFELQEMFPNSIQLTQDGLGNFWVLDIDKKGNWGNVFYISHEPAVVVKHSENLTEFIRHIDEFGSNRKNSNLEIIQIKSVTKIWKKNMGLLSIEEGRKSNDKILKNFAINLPENFEIADLRNAPNQFGFAWGKYGENMGTVIRHDTELLWGFEKIRKKGILYNFFGKK